VIVITAVLGEGTFRLTVNGHEEHQMEGRVCAAVSAITQTALLGLEQVAAQHPDLVQVDIRLENT
jgi:uncharacterized protein YsxB (DUF464 family)